MIESEAQETNQNKLSLIICEFDCNPDEITKKLTLSPTEIALKGDTYQIGPKNNRIDKVIPSSCWTYQQVSNSNQFIGEIATNFVTIQVSANPRLAG